jgi:hypothetical protein
MVKSKTFVIALVFAIILAGNVWAQDDKGGTDGGNAETGTPQAGQTVTSPPTEQKPVEQLSPTEKAPPTVKPTNTPPPPRPTGGATPAPVSTASNVQNNKTQVDTPPDTASDDAPPSEESDAVTQESIREIVSEAKDDVIFETANKIISVQEDIKPDFFLVLGLAIASVVLIIASIVLNIIFFKKKTDKLQAALREKSDNAQENRNDNFLQLWNEISNISYTIDNLSDKIESLANTMKTETPKPQPREPVAPRPMLVETGNPIEDFNKWASNPYSVDLPSWFSYVKGDVKLREELKLTVTAEPAAWICNRKGTEKYLLPNPRVFDELTDISKFYKMDAVGLKAKGQNRLRIKTPCVMSNKGWIEYPGELILL